MNDKQHKLFLWAPGILVAMLLYPPFIVIGATGITLNMGYSWLFDPPTLVNASPKLIGIVNTGLLITQELVCLLVFGAIYIYLGRNQMPKQ